jgi:hypothetical protein
MYQVGMWLPFVVLSPPDLNRPRHGDTLSLPPPVGSTPWRSTGESPYPGELRLRQAGLGTDGLEELDWVSGRILDDGLPPPYTFDHLAAEVNAGPLEPPGRLREVIDLNREAIPATGLRRPAVGQCRSSAGVRGARSAEHQPEISPGQHGKGRGSRSVRRQWSTSLWRAIPTSQATVGTGAAWRSSPSTAAMKTSAVISSAAATLPQRDRTYPYTWGSALP